MNISIGLGQLPPIPLHPLDITALPPSSTPSSTCLGLIQASNAIGSTADLILGIPFLRNVYTILSFPLAPNATATNTTPLFPQPSGLPLLGLISLTDPTTALAEFNNVRVLGQPLDPIAPSPSPQNTQVIVGKKLSVGVTVLIGIVGFFTACGILFGIRWWVLRRRFKREDADGGVRGIEVPEKVEDGGGDVDEEALRQKKWEEGKRKGLFYAESSTGSDWTRVDPAWMLDDRGAVPKQKKEGAEKRMGRSPSRSRSSRGSDADMGHVAQDAPVVPAVDDVDGETDSWGSSSQFYATRKVRETAMTTSVSTIPLDEAECSTASHVQEHFRSSSSAVGTHDRQPSMSSATVTFRDGLDMAGIGARGSVASSGRRVVKPRVVRPASGSGASTSWRGSKWSGEVGDVIDMREGEGKGEGERWTAPEPESKL